MCTECDQGFTSLDGVCVRVGCVEFAAGNSEKCLKCGPEFYMVFDDTRCVV